MTFARPDITGFKFHFDISSPEMFRQQKSNSENSNKTDRDVSGLESAIQCTSLSTNRERLGLSVKSCRPMIATHSDDHMLKSPDHQTGLKQKLVNKVRSWSNKDGKGLQSIDSLKDHTAAASAENTSSGAPEPVQFQSDLLRAKGSLENLIGYSGNQAATSDTGNCRASASSNATAQAKCFSAAGHSDSALETDKTPKVMTWDPWNKLGRKNKKENKRRNKAIADPSPSPSRDSRQAAPIIKSVEHTAGDEQRATTTDFGDSSQDGLDPYRYQPYRQKKSVEFVNNVLVIYFTETDVITKATEPLKKELDQQLRNKEMRRGHVPCTMVGKSHSGGENYMAPWFKK